MELQQAKNQFVQLWGNFGTQWGINRSMAQIHALLMVSEGPMSTDEIMEALQISRGNANMNIRDLVAWNLIYKETNIFHVMTTICLAFTPQKNVLHVFKVELALYLKV